MKGRGWILAAAIAAAGLTSAASSAEPTGRRIALSTVPAEPVVVELFTAQGCAGCLAANQMVEDLAGAPGIIALTYAVDYWDYLGWEDTFARPEFADRQRAYREAFQLRAVSTPQVVIDGRRQVSGARPPELQAAIDEEAARRIFPPEVEFRATGDKVGVGSGRPPRGGAEVVAVTYTPGPQTVEIAAGDNRGRTVRQVNVVRAIDKLGEWTGRPALFELPAPGEGEAVVVLVQARADRRILTAATR